MAGIGRILRVVRINAGNGLCERLSAMGLVPGAAVEILSDGRKGPMIVAVKGSRVVLGRGMALKVLVE
jgi:Fe2+ transport system protein FeoA